MSRARQTEPVRVVVVVVATSLVRSRVFVCLSLWSESRAKLVGRSVVMSSSSWSFMEVLAPQIAVEYDHDDDDYKSNGFAFTDIASEDNNHVHQIS